MPCTSGAPHTTPSTSHHRDLSRFHKLSALCAPALLFRLSQLMDGLNADHNRIAFTGLHEFQYQFGQVFAQSYAFGTHF